MPSGGVHSITDLSRHSAEALAAVARGHGLGATPCVSVEEALDRALRLGAGRVVICGSLYLAGEVLSAARETWPA